MEIDIYLLDSLLVVGAVIVRLSLNVRFTILTTYQTIHLKY